MEGLLDSYEARLRTVESLMAQAIVALKRFREEQDRALEGLRDFLAQNESLRRKDFDAMMGAIRVQRRDKERHVSQVVAGFLLQGQATVEELRTILSDGRCMGVEECRALVGKILTQHQSCERKAGEALRDLHLEQEELGAALKKLLDRGKPPRVRDLKALARVFQVRQSLPRTEVGRILDELTSVREAVAARWRPVLDPGTELASSTGGRPGGG
ncbi:MAG: hypothetical protein ACE5JJ_03145 [Nitrospinota bacterium]